MEYQSPHTLTARSAEHARQRPDHPAIICEGRSLTYRELHEESNRTAHALSATGLRRGDRVGFLGRESEYYFDLVLGCAKSGAVLVPMNWRLTPPEVEHILRDSQATVLFVDREFAPLAARLSGELPWLRATVIMDDESHLAGGFLRWKAGMPDTDPATAAEAGPQDAVALIYTSGTTGLPKGVLLGHRTFFTLIEDTAAAGVDWIDWHPQDRGLSCFPGLHTSGYAWFLHSFNVGATTTVMRAFVPDQAARIIREQEITLVWAAPAMLRMMMNERSVTPEMFRSLRKVVYSGSPIDLELLLRALEVFGCELAQGYSSAEAGSFVTALAPADHRADGARLSSAGRALPGCEVRILDEAGQPAPAGEIGRVQVRSPARFLGYWNRPEADRDVLDGDRLLMGDLGYLDEEGYLHLLDRVGDTIIVAGQNIYPAEVEHVLREHEHVAEVAVYGVPDPHWGEAVRAAVVVRPGREVSGRALTLFLRGKLAGYKIPTGFEFVEELPRNPTGKVLRRALRERHVPEQPGVGART
jgi:fatty-acyl-CoA synthase